MEEHGSPAALHSFGPYTLSPVERVLRHRDQPVILARKTLDVLLVLVSDVHRVISKDELIERVWPETYVDEANVTQNIYVLRQLFKKHQSGVGIENIPKRGYQLTVRAATPLASAARIPQRIRIAAAIVVPLLIAALIGAFVLVHNSRRIAPLNGTALADYMLGQSYRTDGAPQRLAQAATLFARVIHENPNNASGYAALAETDASLAYYAQHESQRTRLQATAMTLARESVRKDPNSADAYAALGGVEFSIAHQAQPAAAHFARALALNPNQSDALVWYGTLLLNDGRVEHARRLFGRALGIQPHAPGVIASLAWSDYVAGDNAGAILLGKQLLLSRRLAPLARITLANAYIAAHDFEPARAAIAALANDSQTRYQSVALAAQLDALTGRSALAVHELHHLNLTANTGNTDAWDAASIAAAYLALRNRQAVFAWLARVDLWERPLMLRDPRFAALARDPHFRAWANG